VRDCRISRDRRRRRRLPAAAALASEGTQTEQELAAHLICSNPLHGGPRPGARTAVDATAQARDGKARGFAVEVAGVGKGASASANRARGSRTPPRAAKTSTDRSASRPATGPHAGSAGPARTRRPISCSSASPAGAGVAKVTPRLACSCRHAARGANNPARSAGPRGRADPPTRNTRRDWQTAEGHTPSRTGAPLAPRLRCVNRKLDARS